MELSAAQLAEFYRNGYLLLPNLLTDDEVHVLQSALPEVLAKTGPEVIREKGPGNAARLVFGAHVYSEPFRRLSLLPRLLDPVKLLLDDDVYLHQSRLNPKYGFSKGAAWAWHQDYPPWQSVDGMPEPRCIMASVFIDDCRAATSPLLVIPGSHHSGLLASRLHEDARSKEYELHHIDADTLNTLASENGIEALEGSAGTVALVHCNVVHGSADNISPWRRAICYLIYNAVSNACTGTRRSWFQNNRDFTPLDTVDDGALVAMSGQGPAPS